MTELVKLSVCLISSVPYLRMPLWWPHEANGIVSFNLLKRMQPAPNTHGPTCRKCQCTAIIEYCSETFSCYGFIVIWPDKQPVFTVFQNGSVNRRRGLCYHTFLKLSPLRGQWKVRQGETERKFRGDWRWSDQSAVNGPRVVCCPLCLCFVRRLSRAAAPTNRSLPWT